MRARQIIFRGDGPALQASHTEILDNYNKHRDLTDEAKIEEMIADVHSTAAFLIKDVIAVDHHPEDPNRLGMYVYTLYINTLL